MHSFPFVPPPPAYLWIVSVCGLFNFGMFFAYIFHVYTNKCDVPQRQRRKYIKNLHIARLSKSFLSQNKDQANKRTEEQYRLLYSARGPHFKRMLDAVTKPKSGLSKCQSERQEYTSQA